MGLFLNLKKEKKETAVFWKQGSGFEQMDF